MKSTNPTKCHWLVCGLAAALLGSASLAGAATPEPIIHPGDHIAYVSGGVGTESLDRLTALSGEFNLKLVFAMNSGAYLSGVRVVIADSTGHTVVDAVSDGPWFLSHLPAGSYQVVASLADKTEKRSITVGAEKLMTLDFRWSAN